ncbi:hypothetical protein ACI65C_011434 [Semiaphis heraclei]
MSVEQIYVRCTIGLNSFVIGGVYIPPNSFSNIYHIHSQTIESLVQNYPFYKFIICGDYNSPEILWENDDCGLNFSFTSCTRAACIPGTFASNGFFQNNKNLNSHGSILDLIFCNIPFLVDKSLEPVVPIDPYHPPLNLTLPFSDHTNSLDNRHSFYNFRKTNYSNVTSFIGSYDWNTTLSTLDPETAFNTLFDALHLSILKFVPKSNFWSTTYPPWFTSELKHINIQKKKAHIEYKTNPNDQNYTNFSLLRARFKYMSKKCFNEYTKHVESSVTNNPSDFWKYVKKNRASNGMSMEISHNGYVSSNKNEIADMFSSVYTTNNINTTNNLPNISKFDLPNNVYFSLDDVFNGLSALKGK